MLEPETAFTHIFGKYSKTPSVKDLNKKSKLNFSSYANFIESRAKLKNQAGVSFDTPTDDEDLEL